MNQHPARMGRRRGSEMSMESAMSQGDIGLTLDEKASYGGLTEQK